MKLSIKGGVSILLLGILGACSPEDTKSIAIAKDEMNRMQIAIQRYAIIYRQLPAGKNGRVNEAGLGFWNLYNDKEMAVLGRNSRWERNGGFMSPFGHEYVVITKRIDSSCYQVELRCTNTSGLGGVKSPDEMLIRDVRRTWLD